VRKGVAHALDALLGGGADASPLRRTSVSIIAPVIYAFTYSLTALVFLGTDCRFLPHDAA
jgi:hypothetical protein